MSGHNNDILPKLEYHPWMAIDDPFSYTEFKIVGNLEISAYEASVKGGVVLERIYVEKFADYLQLHVDFLGEGLEIVNAWWGTYEIGYLGDNLEITDSKYLDISIDYAGNADFNLFDVDNGQLDIGGGNTDGDAYDLGEFEISTAGGNDVWHISQSNEVTVDLGSGDDQLGVSNSKGVIALTGTGDDIIHLSNSQVAYNPGLGEDIVNVAGGFTFGNSADGDEDYLIYDLHRGGDHTAVVDSFDHVHIATHTGLWDARMLDAIDGGLDGQIHLANFNLSLIEVDNYLGGKG